MQAQAPRLLGAPLGWSCLGMQTLLLGPGTPPAHCPPPHRHTVRCVGPVPEWTWKTGTPAQFFWGPQSAKAGAAVPNQNSSKGPTGWGSHLAPGGSRCPASLSEQERQLSAPGFKSCSASSPHVPPNDCPLPLLRWKSRARTSRDFPTATPLPRVLQPMQSTPVQSSRPLSPMQRSAPPTTKLTIPPRPR